MILQELIEQVEVARGKFIVEASGLTCDQAYFKSSPDVWSIAEIAEHMVWAEQTGLNGIWKAIEGIHNHKPVWTGKSINDGLSIEEIIANTWQTKEKVPENAKPRWGGPVDYWLTCLKANRQLLQSLPATLTGLDPEQLIYPHVISGPLNVLQRMQFLRFHLERHQRQIQAIKSHPEYPQKLVRQ